MSQHILRSAILKAALTCGAGAQAATPASTDDQNTDLSGPALGIVFRF